MKRLNISNIHSGKEFADLIAKSKDNCFILEGEQFNSVLSKIDQPELTPMFKIGDTVKLNKDILDFNGVKDNNTWTVVGMEQVDDQYLYIVRNENSKYEFFGYELELVYRRNIKTCV